MIIEEKDFKIIFKDSCYTLYLIKSKKEIKEEVNESLKIGGYFTVIDNAIKKIISFRLSKKYPGKEKPKLLAQQLNEIKQIRNKLDLIMKNLDEPFYSIMKKLEIK